MYTMSINPLDKLNLKAAMLVPILLLSMFTVIPLVNSQVLPNVAKISPVLFDEMASAGESVNVLVKTFTNDYSAVVKQIEELGGKIGHLFKYFSGLSASLPASNIPELSRSSLVERIYYDAERKLSSGSESILGTRSLDDIDALLTKPTMMNSEEYVPVSVTPTDLASIEPANYWNPTAMGAEGIWEETGYGAGSLVVIIDTGIWADHFMFAGTDIIGGVDLSYDVGDPTYEGWSNINNHYHGSHVAGIVASTGGIIVPPTDPLAQAIEMYTGTSLPPADEYGYPGWKLIWLLGMAPFASLYIVKVFDHTGGSVPESMIMAGMEHALDLKLVHGFDVDVVSMSIGGPTVFDGRDAEDQLADTMTASGITMVVAAGNSGPASMTIESPGSAYTSISVGAAATPVQTRVFWDYYYEWPGIGYYLYTTDEVQMYSFSSRGPTSDGRSKPTLSATGIFVLSALTGGQDIGWVSGTSMATPAVSGSVALLNAFAETATGRWKGLKAATPEDYKQALVNGAVWLEGYTEWDQGAGFLNAANALAALKADKSIGDVAPPLPPTGELMDITNIPIVGEGTYSTSVTNLAPGHKVEFIFEITRATEWVKLDVTSVNLGAYNPLRLNSFEVYIQSAKRTYYAYYIDSANVWGNAWFKILDDKTKWSGAVSGVFWDEALGTRVIEPGYMKIVIENDWTSADLLSGSIKITVRAAAEEATDLAFSGSIMQDEQIGWIPISVPIGTKSAIIELRWVNDWTQYPTADLDMVLYWNEGYNLKGATLSSPERVVLDKPTIIYALLIGYAVFGSAEPFELLVWFN